MATVAKREGVTVWIEVDGRRIGVSPDTRPSTDRKDDDSELRL
ncbi:hypothetical protein J2Z17_001983 [Rhizobium halophytocola]|uniref:Uncharacterized protein n=2 Tax=Rhizobium halophytocola TaxID=735519 RepID=A0ABS4DXX5_9HYPH|nr:hypothetical protein [Rhizobium halophytocola]